MKVRTKRTGSMEDKGTKLLDEKKSGEERAIMARLARKKPSPIRFISRVNSPEEIEVEF